MSIFYNKSDRGPAPYDFDAVSVSEAFYDDAILESKRAIIEAIHGHDMAELNGLPVMEGLADILGKIKDFFMELLDRIKSFFSASAPKIKEMETKAKDSAKKYSDANATPNIPEPKQTLVKSVSDPTKEPLFLLIGVNQNEIMNKYFSADPSTISNVSELDDLMDMYSALMSENPYEIIDSYVDFDYMSTHKQDDLNRELIERLVERNRTFMTIKEVAPAQKKIHDSIMQIEKMQRDYNISMNRLKAKMTRTINTLKRNSSGNDRLVGKQVRICRMQLEMLSVFIGHDMRVFKGVIHAYNRAIIYNDGMGFNSLY